MMDEEEKFVLDDDQFEMNMSGLFEFATSTTTSSNEVDEVSLMLFWFYSNWLIFDCFIDRFMKFVSR